MNPVLKFWLLNLAIDFPIPFRLVRDSSGLNVKHLQGLTFEDGVACLVALGQEGLIAFTHKLEDDEGRVVDPSKVWSLMARPRIEQELSFKLTTTGGSAWESLAEPRWGDMDDAEGIPRDEDGRTVGFNWTWFSQNRDRLMAVLGWLPAILPEEQVDLGSVTWKLDADYQVKYWKRLPNVHVVTFRSRVVDRSPGAWKPGGAPEWFQTWELAQSNWYRHPWELEGWPPPPLPAVSKLGS